MKQRPRPPASSRYSVVIPTYDRSQLLRATLDSLLSAARDRSDVEIIVVDDGSRDDTSAMVASLCPDLELVYVRQPDRGFRAARARNLGLRLAGGDMVVLIDSGVAVQQNFFGILDDYDPRGSACVIVPVAGFSNDDDDSERMSAAVDAAKLRGDDVAASLSVNDQFEDIRESIFRSCDDDLTGLPAAWALAWTCCLVIPRGDALGGVLFDEAYEGWGGEDLDYALQLTCAGAEFKIERRTRAIHLPHAKSSTENAASSAVNKAYLHSKFQTAATDALRTLSAIDLNRHLVTVALGAER